MDQLEKLTASERAEYDPLTPDQQEEYWRARVEMHQPHLPALAWATARRIRSPFTGELL